MPPSLRVPRAHAMTGLDTNVLVRYLTQDDAKQAEQATQLIENTLTVANPGFISLVVLTELYWVLGNVHSVTGPEWLDTVDDLLASQRMQLEQREVVQAAVQTCRSSKAGFVGALIVQIDKAAGCGRTVSFDKLAVQLAGMVAV
jgi:predicted nucleic-acid-binding protein